MGSRATERENENVLPMDSILSVISTPHHYPISQFTSTEIVFGRLTLKCNIRGSGEHEGAKS